ncbi:right-handed parallel beta-helix repeat-containing protein [Demequina aestuarii]|uniref:right-handed parallel beta-helix repeat-containing protein n=1 Tax=Demequina aestuarii TaxID=327095 RepID=UPI0007843D94|nr:right-handed parallel beta-helix repeat-containing protein [Demequina aestuarii]
MSHTHPDLSLRTRRALSTAALGLLTATIAVAPASAVPACDGRAATAEDYAAELVCASHELDGPQVITLTGSFAVGGESANVYDGVQPLTVQGAVAGITITGPTVAEQPSGAEGALGTFLTVYGEGSSPLRDVGAPPVTPDEGGPDVTVTDVTIEGFQAVGAINNFSTRLIELSDVSLVDSGAGDFDGSAAVSSAGELTISRSHLEGNAGFFGGAVNMRTGVYSQGAMQDPVVSDAASVTIVDSVFTANAAMVGGAILVFGDTRISGSTFTDNTAETGGAIASYGTSTTLANSLMTGNTAALSPVFGGAFEELAGGAIAVDGSLTVTGSRLTGNSSEDVGGAIAFSESFLERDASFALEASELDDNAASGAGGAVWFQGGVSVSGSTVADNSSGDGAGAIVVTGSGNDVTVANSTVVGNSSDVASPALAVMDAGALAVTHATFVDNTSTGGATDLSVIHTGTTTLTATVWGSGASVPSCDLEETIATTAANFDVDGSCTDDWTGEGDLGPGLDPQLGALADNGGATLTVAPAASSPLVDAVADGASDLAVDQRGVTRPQGEAKDIGAVEVTVEDPEPGVEPGPVEFQIPTGAGAVTATASPAIAVTDVSWIATADLDPAPPADTMLPYGALAFTVEVPQAGDTVTITLTAPRPFTTVLKSGDDAWSKVEGATFSNNGTTVTYTLTDGGDLDEDGRANGFIVDPVALAIQGTFTG